VKQRGGDGVNIGDRVTGVRMFKNRHGDSTKWVELGKVEGMYLGWVVVFDGQWEEETHPDYYGGGRWFVQKKAHRVAVVQPHDKGGRYRKPEYAVLDSLEVMG
jgi:hypothetical protein